jgi:dienelactone hydrolase
LYKSTELAFEHAIDDPRTGERLVRRSHAWLAKPTTPRPERGWPVLLALNGHGGSAWKMLDANDKDFWYGDAFARRGFVVLAVDISHRPPADRGGLYGDARQGDDPAHGNAAHPSIHASGLDSDWEENGERAWDAMRALDWLLEQPDIDRRRVVATGLSMGGEMTTIVGGLDPRIAVSVPSGYSPDDGVLTWCGGHPCWRWLHANIREWVDSSDFLALTAPRPLIVQTGARDFVYSWTAAPFASDKTNLRRARAAYGNEAERVVHDLHQGGHAFHASALRRPRLVEPAREWTWDWQTDARTTSDGRGIFEILDELFEISASRWR